MQKKRLPERNDADRRCVNGRPNGVSDTDDVMGAGCFEEEYLRETARLVRQSPDLDPPDILLQSVMASVRTARLPLRARMMRWFKAPRTITFTPMRALSAAALLFVAGAAIAFHVFKTEHGNGVTLNGRTPVVLTLTMPGARSVAVIGSFNGWRSQNCELLDGNGGQRWAITLSLPAGRYEYAFVVDGERIVPDPFADIREDDGFGNQNAILLIGNANENSA